MKATLGLSLWQRIWASPKMRVLFSGTLSQTLELENFTIARQPLQLLSAYSSKLAMVVGRQFITLSIYLYVMAVMQTVAWVFLQQPFCLLSTWHKRQLQRVDRQSVWD